MKYIIILSDGMSDFPLDTFGGKTPMEVAKKPNMDKLCQNGEIGLLQTVPETLPPGSDVANLAVFGYDPFVYYTGRSPLEAASMGVSLADSDMTYRANLVTLSDDEDYTNKTMLDYSAGEISTEEARALIADVNAALKTDDYEFYGGISYRHLMVWHNMDEEFPLTPPHDISDKKIIEYLPTNSVILELMKKSYDILKDHPINKERIANGKNPANSIWIWGAGKKPQLKPFAELYGKSGAVISAVDLIRGIGVCAGLKVIEVPGTCGTIDTNFDGEAQAAIDALLKDNLDFVYLHIEAPDEAGHQGKVEDKIRAIELIDEKMVGPIVKALNESGEDFRLLISPDHATPVALKTHTRDAVPYMLYDSRNSTGSGKTYTEQNAKDSGNFINDGYKIMKKLLGE